MTTTTHTRKSAEQRKHEHYSTLVTLLRQGRIHRMVVEEHSEHTFADGEHVDFYASGTYTGYAYMVVYGVQGYECGCEKYEHRHSCQHTKDAAARAAERYHESQRAEELAVAEQVAPLVLVQQFASDLQVHLEDEMPTLPVVVRMEDDRNVYIITPDNRYECVRAADLDYFYPEHREATDAEILYLNSAEGPLRQGRQVVRASYREMYAADFNSIAS